MNNYISKKILILINVILFILEVIMIYLVVKAILTNDFISPTDITFLEYVKIKLENLI